MRAKNIFLTATGTEIGKTYVSGLMLKTMRKAGFGVGYFKTGLSGTDASGETDLAYAIRVGNPVAADCPYIYKNAVSPHLAGKLENNPAKVDVVVSAHKAVADKSDMVIIEGSGGALCPITYEGERLVMLTDIVSKLFGSDKPRAIVLASCKLGTINATVLTVDYLVKQGFEIAGIIFNQYTGGIMEDDNIAVIPKLTGLKVIDIIKDGGELNISADALAKLF